ncbi:MAG: hypothetical protein IEMM0008_1720 [bacterium]|nr:MAG: hypothetical protein IEMM0008_1720 [bacterium]
MKLTDYDFQLPEELIAQYPREKRDESRLLVVNRQRRDFTETRFKNIGDYLDEGDCLVLNNTRVFPARLYGTSLSTGKKHEVVLVNYQENKEWKVMIRGSKRCKVHDRFQFMGNIEGELIKKLPEGLNIIAFNEELSYQKLMEIGEMALPPYIIKLRKPIAKDKETYQTVYSTYIKADSVPSKGSIAAPTAGLHFTRSLLDSLKKKEFYFHTSL